jgi:hypothetical protein
LPCSRCRYRSPSMSTPTPTTSNLYIARGAILPSFLAPSHPAQTQFVCPAVPNVRALSILFYS